MATFLLWGLVAVLFVALVLPLSDQFFERLKAPQPDIVLWEGPPTAEQQAALDQGVDLILTHQPSLMMLEHALTAEADRRGVKIEGDQL